MRPMGNVRAAIGLLTFVATACTTPDSGHGPDVLTFGPSPTGDDGGPETETDVGATSTNPGGTGMAEGSTGASDGTSADAGSGDTGPGDPCGAVTCDPNATCDGGTCACDPGYEGDGISCADIDGCAAANCFAGVECTDVPAPGDGFECGDCPTGYEGDGVSCSDVDGCAPSPCYAGVTCTDNPAPMEGASCGACPTGYEGDGFSCADIDGCAGAPCYVGVTCSDVPAPGTGFSCGPCPAGLYGDGISCLAATPIEIGDLTNSATLGPYFRANGYVADANGTLAEFEVYLGNAGGCSLDFYVFEAAAPGGALTQLWRNTVAGAGTGYQASGPIDLPVTSGMYYALGVGWNCSLIYYWNNTGTWSGFDAGIGIFNNTRWDNSYPGPSDFYLPPNTGGGTTTYPQKVWWVP